MSSPGRSTARRRLNCASPVPSEDSTLSRIIDMLQEAQSRRAPSQRQVDRFAHYYYTPTVALSALALALIPPLFFGGSFLEQRRRRRLALSRAVDAGDRLPLRAGDQHAGDGDQRASRRRRGAAC